MRKQYPNVKRERVTLHMKTKGNCALCGAKLARAYKRLPGEPKTKGDFVEIQWSWFRWSDDVVGQLCQNCTRLSDYEILDECAKER